MPNTIIQNFLQQTEMAILQGLFTHQHWSEIRSVIETGAINGAGQAMADHIQNLTLDTSAVDSQQNK